MSQEAEESVGKVTNLQHLPIPDPKAFKEDSWAFQDVAAEEEMKCQLENVVMATKMEGTNLQPLPISKVSDQEILQFDKILARTSAAIITT